MSNKGKKIICEESQAEVFGRRIESVSQEVEALRSAAEGKQIIVVLGNTGCGKSTTLNWLAGNALKSDEDGVKILLVDPNQKGAPAIGTGLDCQTVLPEAITIDGLEFYDLPGFYDTRGKLEELINVAFIKQLLEKAAGVKILFVFSRDEIDAKRGASIKKFLNDLERMLGGCYHDVICNSSLFIMTKSPYRTMDRVKNFFEETIRNSVDCDCLKFLHQRIEEGKMFHVRTPVLGEDNYTIVSGDKGKILDALRGCRGSKLSDLNFSCIYSEGAREALRDVFNELFRQNFDEIFPDFKTLKTVNSYRQAIEKVKGPSDMHFEKFWNSFIANVAELSTIKLLLPLAPEAFDRAIKNFVVMHNPFLQALVTTCDNNIRLIESRVLLELEKRMEYIAMDRTGNMLKDRTISRCEDINAARKKIEELKASSDAKRIENIILSSIEADQEINRLVQEEDAIQLYEKVLANFREHSLGRYVGQVRDTIAIYISFYTRTAERILARINSAEQEESALAYARQAGLNSRSPYRSRYYSSDFKPKLTDPGILLNGPLSGDPRIVVGSKVIIHKHRPVDGVTNWATAMNQYLGREAIVIEFTGNDRKGCRMARLSVNGTRANDFVFRVRDLEYTGEGDVSDSDFSSGDTLSGNPKIVVGSKVIIHKHRPVSGDTNWASMMDKYIGREATVIGFTGLDSKGCSMARLRVNGIRVNDYVFRVRDLEFCDGNVSDGSGYIPCESLSGDSRILIGSTVVIHRHRPVDGHMNWTSDMDQYVGLEATIIEFTGTDSKGCEMAIVGVDDIPLKRLFRVRDLEFVSGGIVGYTPSQSLSGDSRIAEGSRVIIRRHRPVNGDSNWVSDMDDFIGREATVVEFTGTDSARCKMARLSVGGRCLDNVFRVRDLEYSDGIPSDIPSSSLSGCSSSCPPSQSLSGDPRIVKGSKVIIHRHRPVGGDSNWVSEMDPYIGREATIVEFTGTDSARCKMARLSVGGRCLDKVFRVRDLEYSAGIAKRSVVPSSSLSGCSSSCTASQSLSGDPRIVKGSRVIIHEHRPVDGSKNWLSDMNQYIGREAQVLEFTGSDVKGCKMARLSVGGRCLNRTFRVRDLELCSCSQSASLSTHSTGYTPCESPAGDPNIVEGSRVIIHEHRPVKGTKNWAPDMDQYVGREATIVQFTGNDSMGCKMARLIVDGRRLNRAFRVRDLEPIGGGGERSGPVCSPSPSSSSSGCGRNTPCSSLAGDSRIMVGSRVIIHEHRPVDGVRSWNSAMDKYVGQEVRVVRFTGTDLKGCRMARVTLRDRTLEYSFRVRDLEFIG